MKTKKEEQIKNLITEYQDLVFSICQTGDYFASEDLFQEVFLAAYLHLDEFDGCNQKAWICRIASNKSIDYIRSAARRSVPTEDINDVAEAASLEDDKMDPMQHYINLETMRELEENCKSLPPPYDEVAVGHFCKGLSVAELSEQNGVNKKTVQTRIYRARNMLKKKMKGGHKK